LAAALVLLFLPACRTTGSKPAVREVRQGGFRYINPLLECENFSASGFRELRPFLRKIEAAVAGVLRSQRATHVSIYFRDLNNGPWFGIHEDEQFSPASLLKVPILMTLLHQAETRPELLSLELPYVSADGDENVNQHHKPAEEVELGKSYPVDELLRRMIVYSENNARPLLLKVLDTDEFLRLLDRLGIAVPMKEGVFPDDYMDIKDYASFFRILYNATYLRKENSEKALAILAQSDFREGLVADLPPDVLVAHKFGERRHNNLNQLHDCGIVYFPGHPYLLGVMTRGKKFDELARVIAELSRLVYDEVNRQYGRP